MFSGSLFQRIRGLGGFRNILVHRYLGIDPGEVYDNFHKGGDPGLAGCTGASYVKSLKHPLEEGRW